MTPEDGFAGLSSKLAVALEGAATEVDSILEEECRSLFSAAVTRVFGHLYLQDPGFDFITVIRSIAPESRVAAEGAMKGHVDALLKKFLCVPDPEAPAAEDVASTLTTGFQRLGRAERWPRRWWRFFLVLSCNFYHASWRCKNFCLNLWNTMCFVITC